MPGEHGKLADLAGLIVGDDMDHGNALDRTAEPLTIVERVMPRLSGEGAEIGVAALQASREGRNVIGAKRFVPRRCSSEGLARAGRS